MDLGDAIVRLVYAFERLSRHELGEHFPSFRGSHACRVVVISSVSVFPRCYKLVARLFFMSTSLSYVIVRSMA